MPIERHRNHDDARRALWLPAGSPRLAREWEACYRLSLLAPSAPPPRGVHKFADIEALNRDTERWIGERVRQGKLRIRPTEPPEEG